MDVTRRIGEYVTGIDIEDFPPEAVEAAKAAIMDCLACMLAGCRESLADILCRYVSAESAAPAASVVGGDSGPRQPTPPSSTGPWPTPWTTMTLPR